MAFHADYDGKRLILAFVPGNLERLWQGLPIQMAVNGLEVVIVGGRTPVLAAERMREVTSDT